MREAAIAALDAADVTPLQVYADYLSHSGDPRGEFIALQLEETPSRANWARQRALLKKHRKTWLGRAAPMLTEVKWSRGFPREATLSYALPERPSELCTLRTLHCARGSTHHRTNLHLLLLDPVLHGLTRVTGFVSDETFVAWARGPRRPLVHTALPDSLFRTYDRWIDAVEDALGHAPGLVDLRSVGTRHARHPSGWRRLLETQLGRQVEQVEVKTNATSLGAWLQAYPSRTLEIRLVSGALEVSRRRREHLSVRCTLGRIYEANRSITAARYLTEVFEELPEDAFAEVEVAFGGTYTPTAPDRLHLERAWARLSRAPLPT